MKRIAYILMPLAIAVLALLSIAATSGSYSNGKWLTIRAISDHNDTGPDANSADLNDTEATLKRQGIVDDGNDHILCINPQEPVGIVQVSFFGAGDENTTATWMIEANADTPGAGSPWRYVAHGEADVGTTDTDIISEHWCDDITLTNENWDTSLVITDGYQYDLGTGAVSGGGQGVVTVDTLEYRYWRVRMSTPGPNDANSFGAKIRAFNPN